MIHGSRFPFIAIVVVAAATNACRRNETTQTDAARGKQQATSTAAAAPASLFCEFYDFMHKSVVTSYDFKLEQSQPIVFGLKAMTVHDDTKTRFGSEDTPKWSLAADDGTPALQAPDGDTRILLYGLQPRSADTVWGEAGIRSTATRNLEGRCRQTHFATLHIDNNSGRDGRSP